MVKQRFRQFLAGLEARHRRDEKTVSPLTEETVLAFNGIDGVSGQYLVEPRTVARLADDLRDAGKGPPRPAEPTGPVFRTARPMRYRPPVPLVFRGCKHGVNELDLGEAGWGVIFPQSGVDEGVLDALTPLLERRAEQAGERFRCYVDASGYRVGESGDAFLARFDQGPGAADPDLVPYYLLLVGTPEEIPFDVQCDLGFQRAVGRLDLEDAEAVRRYAETVVAVEEGEVERRRGLVFFGAEQLDDPATRTSRRMLIEPLGEAAAAWGCERRGLVRSTIVGREATRRRLLDCLSKEERPAVLLTASHGLGFDAGHARQRAEQGALACSGDWTIGTDPGDDSLTAARVTDDMDVAGMIQLAFGCFTAGTPRDDQFRPREGRGIEPLGKAVPPVLAPGPFVARLPQKLLGHPRGSALAFVGHVDRAWSCSFWWPGAGGQVETFGSILKSLVHGEPVGHALRYMRMKEGDAGKGLENIENHGSAEDRVLAFNWTARHDARNYVVLGDPAVRVPGLGGSAAK